MLPIVPKRQTGLSIEVDGGERVFDVAHSAQKLDTDQPFHWVDGGERVFDVAHSAQKMDTD